MDDYLLWICGAQYFIIAILYGLYEDATQDKTRIRKKDRRYYVESCIILALIWPFTIPVALAYKLSTCRVQAKLNVYFS